MFYAISLRLHYVDSAFRHRGFTRTGLKHTALSEARRLDRTVQNLLDITRLGYGALTPNRSIFDLREIVGQVRSELV